MAHAHAHGRGVGRRDSARGLPEAVAARRAANRRRMLVAAAINAGMFALGVAGGIITRSLPLLADAGHVLSDLAAIALALIAARVAARAAGPPGNLRGQRTQGIAPPVERPPPLALPLPVRPGA